MRWATKRSPSRARAPAWRPANWTSAGELARLIGIRHEVIETGELSMPEYLENTPDRCYFCKTELFVEVEKLAARLGVAVVADGSNRDDRGEHRPGLRAAGSAMSAAPWPSAVSRRGNFVQLAAAWGLPTWNKPATPCLSSRIAYGEPVTPERLAMIDQAEAYLRGRGFQPLRVRYHKGDMARIEVASEGLAKFADAEFRRQVGEAQVAGVPLRFARPGRISQRQPQRRVAAGESADRREEVEGTAPRDGRFVGAFVQSANPPFTVCLPVRMSATTAIAAATSSPTAMAIHVQAGTGFLLTPAIGGHLLVGHRWRRSRAGDWPPADRRWE